MHEKVIMFKSSESFIYSAINSNFMTPKYEFVGDPKKTVLIFILSKLDLVLVLFDIFLFRKMFFLISGQFNFRQDNFNFRHFCGSTSRFLVEH